MNNRTFILLSMWSVYILGICSGCAKSNLLTFIIGVIAGIVISIASWKILEEKKLK